MTEIPLKPIGRQDIHKLETYLLIGTLLRKDVLERIKNAEDRLTWIDSLAVAAGALAREKAGIPTSQIADELGRTEATIRNHINRKTEAGKLVWETFEMLRRGQQDPIALILSVEDIDKVKSELDRALKEREELAARMKSLENEVNNLRSKLDLVKTKLEEALKLI
jgi:hypothetical protein